MFRALARWWPRPAAPPIPNNAHALARMGQASALVEAVHAHPALALARDGLGLSPLGAALTGWGGPCVPWPARRAAALAVLDAAGMAGTQGPAALPLLALAPCDPVFLAAALPHLPPPCPGHPQWRALLAAPVRADTLDDLAGVLDLIEPAGIPRPDWCAIVSAALSRPPLGRAFATHPTQSLDLLAQATGLTAQALLPALSPASGHAASDIAALGRGLAQCQALEAGPSTRPAPWSCPPALGPWLARWGQSVDWAPRLAARLARARLQACLDEPATAVRLRRL